jgi:amidase
MTEVLAHTSIVELQAAMATGQLKAVDLVRFFLARIDALDRQGPRLNAVLEINPAAESLAAALDEERHNGHVRGPLHGIPILLKDNIDTADRMQTTAGSLALVGSPPNQDATVAARLRAAGAVLLGKTNMIEWANFRSNHSTSGWCGRNGQSRNPYVLDRNPSGSSSGSGIAAAAALSVVSIGTETDGSIVAPASANGVVGIKPTVGLTSRAGVVPVSHSQDTVGPLARSVADAAAVLGALTGVDERDPATQASAGRFFADYMQCLDAHGLQGARIGVVRNVGFNRSPPADAIAEQAIQVLREAGAIIVDPANLPSDLDAAFKAEFEVLLYEFKADLNQYLATRQDIALDREGFEISLSGAIAFNERHREQELRYFGQEHFLQAQAKGPITDPAYLAAIETSRRLSRQEGIDAVLEQHQLDALVAPSGSPAWPTDLVNGDHFTTGSSGPAAHAGYPLTSVPAGFAFGLPVNITFMGRAFSEPTLIRLAYAFEQETMAWRAPKFIPTLALE